MRGIFQNCVNKMRLHAYSDVEHAFLKFERMMDTVLRLPIFSRRGDKSARNENRRITAADKTHEERDCEVFDIALRKHIQRGCRKHRRHRRDDGTAQRIGERLIDDIGEFFRIFHDRQKRTFAVEDNDRRVD